MGAAMTEQRVSVTITDGVADVRLNRPEKRNALDGAMFAGLVTAGERLKAEPRVRAVVLSGAGQDFCAGLDFGWFRAMRDGERLSALVDLPPGDGAGPAGAQPAALGSAPPTSGRRSRSRSSRPSPGTPWVAGCRSRSGPISASSLRTRGCRCWRSGGAWCPT